VPCRAAAQGFDAPKLDALLDPAALFQIHMGEALGWLEDPAHRSLNGQTLAMPWRSSPGIQSEFTGFPSRGD
jgi:hypothetical protein